MSAKGSEGVGVANLRTVDVRLRASSPDQDRRLRDITAGFFIDHGTGLVIGETCVIGNGVKIYQGVTLGAQSFPQDEQGRVIKGTKRHPDIEDDVTIYAGATILGPVRVGRGSIIGGNVWLTQSVPAETRIVVQPAQRMHVDQPVLDFQI
jgi:serine acetyltransferase